MNGKYKNKYRISSTRLSNYNYNSNAAYFITICTKNKKHFFGEILPGAVQMPCLASPSPSQPPQSKIDAGHGVFANLSPIGKIAQEEWMKTPSIRPDMNIELGVFVVMPNHFHAVFIIGENGYNEEDDKEYQNQFGPQRKNIASIMRGFKSAVTSRARRINPDFGWQTLFHDHIIRNENAFWRISEYIENNPSKWIEDKFY